MLRYLGDVTRRARWTPSSVAVRRHTAAVGGVPVSHHESSAQLSRSKKAVVLLSGGLDSTTLLAIAQSTGYEVHCLSFEYGQRHQVELQAACEIAKRMKAAAHSVVKLDLRVFGGSALTSDSIDVPKDRDEAEMASEIPVTYVPARNTVSVAFAEILKANSIFIGVNAVDYSGMFGRMGAFTDISSRQMLGYPDCRPEYIAAYEKMAQLATRTGVEGEYQLQIHTPLMYLTKVQIIELGLKLNVDYASTHSCYDPIPPDGRPCEHCDSCLLRISAFGKLGMKDPAIEKYKK